MASFSSSSAQVKAFLSRTAKMSGLSVSKNWLMRAVPPGNRNEDPYLWVGRLWSSSSSRSRRGMWPALVA
ncbi:uncharacterized protein CIMG_12838 [Coccidioides immitis RS]|uniref:Uncharacterized protein n=1 Tax=Coccidioides immitis (strain RS) TaxID=246410 RepID=J3KHQ1_COCIM|nr:uncharacterized protein CIMG_12838 [Coccidioides immitis RS]EAS35420.3 hypothetical protein CIMG_12838 [Coccidioides immitis RS]